MFRWSRHSLKIKYARIYYREHEWLLQSRMRWPFGSGKRECHEWATGSHMSWAKCCNNSGLGNAMPRCLRNFTVKYHRMAQLPQNMEPLYRVASPQMVVHGIWTSLGLWDVNPTTDVVNYEILKVIPPLKEWVSRRHTNHIPSFTWFSGSQLTNAHSFRPLSLIGAHKGQPKLDQTFLMPASSNGSICEFQNAKTNPLISSVKCDVSGI